MRWISSLFARAEEGVEQPDLNAEPSGIGEWQEPTRRGNPLPRFRGTAADQLSAHSRLHDRERLQLRKAFTPARPVMDPAMFAGRADLLQTIIRAIEDQYLHVVLFGPRGIGKTSTLHVLCGIARESRYIVRYVSCGERTRFDTLFRAVLADIPLLFHQKYDPTATEIEEGLSFADLLDDQPLSVDRASDILGKVAGTRLLIVLDEFDRASDADFRRSVAELIKNLSDRGSPVQLVIAGVAQNLTELIEHVPSIRRNILGLLLPNMRQDEIAELIGNGQQASGMTFTPKALRLVSLAALGLPYLASLVAQHAGLAALDRGSTTIDHSDVERGMGQVLDHLNLRIPPDMRYRMESAIAGGHERVLGQLAQVALANSFRLPLTEIARELDDAPGSSSVLRELEVRYRLVAPLPADAAGAYGFMDDGVPLFLWVRLMHGHVRDDVGAA
ncbi:Archaeal ATPase [Sphingomonas jeddahensis]|uniref:Archaeal ATPase n=1 Tax=Sphingomonas jeddahensis TaxID=1915074 RepID=A0A1V2EVK0_9SPHN|nr:Archaeal ATPase [Sphingomonas jeddahensis]